MKESVLVVAPGRGSYSKSTMGILQNRESKRLQALHEYRQQQERLSPIEIDAFPRFQSSKHLAGEEASLLTAACSIADFDEIDQERYDIVGICGNSMGHYTALILSEVLSLLDGATLIDTMGEYQRGNIIGGQQVYPICDEDWNIVPQREKAVQSALANIENLYLSIDLGYQKIIAGTKEALSQAQKYLPSFEQSKRTFPITLPMHSAFHTPLLQHASNNAKQDLQGICWNHPSYTLIDGQGSVASPWVTNPQIIKDYTLGAQVSETYQFRIMIQHAISLLAPERIILLGPGSNLGGAIAQSIIDIGWYGIHSKKDFLQRQDHDPILLSMGRSEQRKKVTR